MHAARYACADNQGGKGNKGECADKSGKKRDKEIHLKTHFQVFEFDQGILSGKSNCHFRFIKDQFIRESFFPMKINRFDDL